MASVEGAPRPGTTLTFCECPDTTTLIVRSGSPSASNDRNSGTLRLSLIVSVLSSADTSVEMISLEATPQRRAYRSAISTAVRGSVGRYSAPTLTAIEPTNCRLCELRL